MAAPPLLKKLSQAVYLAEPATSAQDGVASGGAVKAPELILVSAWMGAQVRHIQKYCETYRQLYPRAAILVVRSNERDFFSSTATLTRSFMPAVDLLKARASGFTAGPQSGLLVHIFSNGGCLTIKHINDLLRQSSVKGDARPLLAKGLPARTVIFDSCPGLATWANSMRAFTAGVKSPFVKYPMITVLSVIYGFIRLWDFIRRRPPTLNRLSAYFNSPLFPSVPRLYLYSPTDALVRHTDVEHHAAEAKANGVDVRLERFKDTPHVAHARVEPKRYWGAVQELWEGSGAK
ncbi:hypothetical protein Rhopal_002464-T1 [Rhodotorula paludigena]|uniref:Indole-diterpene biosynthesis protein PaxU n=1 Tax=Rhodotorula paludigena TaxID=86838 RepID=A0AAV5GGZ8_9BASI|nr:hypothetical protein Rhopal_002464-T1 [Rhodotorula paludigena]